MAAPELGLCLKVDTGALTAARLRWALDLCCGAGASRLFCGWMPRSALRSWRSAAQPMALIREDTDDQTAEGHDARVSHRHPPPCSVRL